MRGLVIAHSVRHDREWTVEGEPGWGAEYAGDVDDHAVAEGEDGGRETVVAGGGCWEVEKEGEDVLL